MFTRLLKLVAKASRHTHFQKVYSIIIVVSIPFFNQSIYLWLVCVTHHHVVANV